MRTFTLVSLVLLPIAAPAIARPVTPHFGLAAGRVGVQVREHQPANLGDVISVRSPDITYNTFRSVIEEEEPSFASTSSSTEEEEPSTSSSSSSKTSSSSSSSEEEEGDSSSGGLLGKLGLGDAGKSALSGAAGAAGSGIVSSIVDGIKKLFNRTVEFEFEPTPIVRQTQLFDRGSDDDDADDDEDEGSSSSLLGDLGSSAATGAAGAAGSDVVNEIANEIKKIFRRALDDMEARALLDTEELSVRASSSSSDDDDDDDNDDDDSSSSSLLGDAATSAISGGASTAGADVVNGIVGELKKIF